MATSDRLGVELMASVEALAKENNDEQVRYVLIGIICAREFQIVAFSYACTSSCGMWSFCVFVIDDESNPLQESVNESVKTLTFQFFKALISSFSCNYYQQNIYV